MGKGVSFPRYPGRPDRLGDGSEDSPDGMKAGRLAFEGSAGLQPSDLLPSPDLPSDAPQRKREDGRSRSRKEGQPQWPPFIGPEQPDHHEDEARKKDVKKHLQYFSHHLKTLI